MIKTFQNRRRRSRAGGYITVRERYDDEPATMLTASANMLRLCQETGVSLDNTIKAMKLLGSFASKHGD